MFASVFEAIGRHGAPYLLVAGAVCALAGAARLWLHQQTGENRGAGSIVSLALQTLAIGSGVWGASVIAMLGYRDGASGVLSATAIGLAFAVAIVSVLPSFFLRRLRGGSLPRVMSALLMTLSFALVHYSVISGFHVRGRLHWNLGYEVVAVLAAYAFSYASILIRSPVHYGRRMAAPVALLVCSLASLHFIPLAGLSIEPDPRVTVRAVGVSRLVLANAVAGTALLFLALAAMSALIEAMGERKALRRLRIATNALPSAIALFDSADRLLIWNATFEMIMTGAGVAVRENMPFIEMSRAMPAPELAVGGVVPRVHTQVEFQIPGAQWIRVETIPTEDGGLLNIGADITDIKRSEAALSAALEAAQAANLAKSEFLATMSHEIRTPLNGVLGMAQAMSRDELSPAQRERLQVVETAGESLLALLNDVLDLSKIEAGKVDIEDGVIDVEAMAASVKGIFSSIAAEKDVSLTLDVAPEARGRWRGDPVRVRQILQNLVGNAVKFTDRGVISVRIDLDPRGLVMSVSDTGPGIDDTAKARLFEKFAQGDASTTRRYGGSGLGLSICRSLCELMGGGIGLESTPGVGSVFTVSLPLERCDDAAAEPRASPQEDAPTAWAGLRILAAEDNQMNQLVLKTLLSQVGLDPHVVGNGEEALLAWSRENWDLVLMDVQMPVMDGPTATRRIRALESELGRPRTPILALTANAMSHHADEYRSAGMDGLIAKPIKVAELIAAVGEALQNRDEDAREALADDGVRAARR